MIYIIGSGPSGVSLALALIKKNIKVTLIDYGLNPLNESLPINKNKLDPDYSKLLNGSNFPYRNINKRITIKPNKYFMSYALGGLSNVWGAAILPYRVEDIKLWPTKTKTIFSYYKEILKFIPNTIPYDSVSKYFNFISKKNENENKINIGALEQYYKKLTANYQELQENGITVGKAKLAIDFNDKDNKCTYCNKCMTGCPQDLIFNSKNIIGELIKNKNFSYKSGYIVEKLSDNGNFINIEALHKGKKIKIKSERVYLAAGTLSTTKIICSSYNYFNKPLYLLDSQYFAAPFLSFKSIGKLVSEKDYSLSKIFVEINNSKNKKFKSSHLQIYTLNNEILKNIESKFLILKPLISLIIKIFSTRLLLVQGYLHSDDSSKLKFILKKKENQEIIELSEKINLKTNNIINNVIETINKKNNIFGGFILKIFKRTGYPGEGNHFGGVFPMKNKPKKFETDVYGRQNFSKRIHIVDSSILPSLPASTITLSVMANAYRIGAEYDKYK